jgi:hypothetical protein
MEFLVVLAWFAFLACIAGFRTGTIQLSLFVVWTVMGLSALFALGRLLFSLLLS